MDPVFLDCGHSICKGCAEKICTFQDMKKGKMAEMDQKSREPKKDKLEDEGIPCPTCSQKTRTPMAALKINFPLREIADKHRDGKKTSTPCEGGCDGAAECFCRKCEDSFCNSCFASHVAAALLHKHEKAPLSEAQSQ